MGREAHDGTCDTCSVKNRDYNSGGLSFCGQCISKYITAPQVSDILKVEITHIRNGDSSGKLFPPPATKVNIGRNVALIWDKCVVMDFAKNSKLPSKEDVNRLLNNGFTISRAANKLKVHISLVKRALEVKSIDMLHSQAHELLSRRM